MICAVCYGVLRGHQGIQWRGTFDLHFDHQPSKAALEKSASIGCCICRSIRDELSLIEKKDLNQRNTRTNTLSGAYRYLGRWLWGELSRLNRIDLSGQPDFISAYLSEVPELEQAKELDGEQARAELGSGHLEELKSKRKPKVYRLDFRVRDSERVGTFVLEQVGDASRRLLHTPFSSSTSSDEVLEVAKGWINRCTSEDHPDCPNEPPETPVWYPSRLIDLGDMVETTGRKLVRDDPPQISQDPEKARKAESKEDSEYVRLVSKDEEHRMKGFYVTLSHCWGGADVKKLTESKIGDFKKGFNMKDLPKTFEDAIRFARRLGNKPGQVRYIWIDSLCIIQADQPSEVQKADWLHESAEMHKIYNNSYCNISATAATNSSKGLFHPREPHLLWEDEINLNTEGIPGYTPEELIQRCKIIDLSFWERSLDDAPVNRRAWVLQERLMAPRVLHFCQDQIAWECRKVDASESFRDGIASFRLKSGDIERAERLKSFIPHSTEGYIDDLTDPEYLDKRLATYHHWKSVVERYSKTKLTNPEDKLIALSGIAKLMSGQLPGVEYVAGLWRQYLESQLLWRVDPVFKYGKFSFPSTRPQDYRAPSFSWAAIDAERGITYGEFTDKNLLITIERFEVFQDKGADKFGLVKKGCFVELLGVLKPIVLKKRFEENGVRYHWDLAGRPREETETYSNVYLDSPGEDANILGSGGRMYCLPAREDSNKYLICLLLQKDTTVGNQYRRVGLTKVPPYDEEGQRQVFDPQRAQDTQRSIRIV